MNIPPKIFFLSDSGNSSLAEFLLTNLYHESFDISFEKLQIEFLRKQNPDLIVIDLYFIKKPYYKLVKEVLIHFNKTPVYFLSPFNDDSRKIAKKITNPSQYISSFSGDIVRKINNYLSSYEVKQYARVG